MELMSPPLKNLQLVVEMLAPQVPSVLPQLQLLLVELSILQPLSFYEYIYLLYTTLTSWSLFVLNGTPLSQRTSLTSRSSDGSFFLQSVVGLVCPEIATVLALLLS